MKKILVFSSLVFLLVGCDAISKLFFGELETPVAEVSIFSCNLSDDFYTSGVIDLNLLPLDINGSSILSEGVVVIGRAEETDSYGNVTSYTLTTRSKSINYPSLRANPWAFAVDIDSSGSMSWNDSNRLRVSAAKNFVSEIFDIDSNSEMAIYDFGAGYTTGYSYTRDLSNGWTSNEADLFSAIDTCKQSGGTPLYESVKEILDSFNNTKSASSYERAMLVLSDGEPNSSSNRDSVIEKSLAYKIPINTVILGTDGYYTMKKLADDTGGVFVSATEADDLGKAFKNVTLGTTQGYITYELVFDNLDDYPTNDFKLILSIISGDAIVTETIEF